MDPATAARVTVRAGSDEVSGGVRRDLDKYVNVVEGVELGVATGLDLAIYRLTTNLRILLPAVAPPGWEVFVDDAGESDLRIVITEGDLRFDGDPIDDAMPDLVNSLPVHTLSDAIECAVQIVRHRVGLPREVRTFDPSELEPPERPGPSGSTVPTESP